MAKQKKASGEDSDAEAGGRTTLNVSSDVHRRLKAFCSDEFPLAFAADMFLTWCLDQHEDFKVCVMHRNRMGGSERLRKAFGEALQQLTDEIGSAGKSH